MNNYIQNYFSFAIIMQINDGFNAVNPSPSIKEIDSG